MTLASWPELGIGGDLGRSGSILSGNLIPQCLASVGVVDDEGSGNVLVRAFFEWVVTHQRTRVQQAMLEVNLKVVVVTIADDVVPP